MTGDKRAKEMLPIEELNEKSQRLQRGGLILQYRDNENLQDNMN